jgi:hypothetical protein
MKLSEILFNWAVSLLVLGFVTIGGSCSAGVMVAAFRIGFLGQQSVPPEWMFAGLFVGVALAVLGATVLLVSAAMRGWR